MNSLKNTAIAVILLGISFGLYQISLTPTPEIDPSLTPTIDISEGLSQSASPSSANGAHSNGSLLPPALAIQPPPLSPHGVNATPPIAANVATNIDRPINDENTKLPLQSTAEKNVQSIQYPLGNSFANQLANSKPKPPQISQRELVDASRDAGLIDALKSHDENKPSIVPQQSASTPPKSPAIVPIAPNPSGDNSFNTVPKTAQTIGTTKPVNDPFATEMASADMTPKNASSDFEFGSRANPAATLDQQVQQAQPQSNLDDLTFKTVWPKVDELVAKNDFRSALQILSRFYHDEDLSGPQRQRLIGWLDALAGKVIFSDENNLVPQAYVAMSDESLADLATEWKVPAQLIYNVNQQSLPNPVQVQAGTKLKQISGPFNAEVKLDTNVMTLFLGDLYAGRFPIRVGISGTPKPGTYNVLVKSAAGHAWRDSKGIDYPPDSPENGYGPYWIGLSESLCIHAVEDDATDGHYGCIGLSETDAADVFAILSEGSQLKIVQ